MHNVHECLAYEIDIAYELTKPWFRINTCILSADDPYRFSLVIYVKYSNEIATISLVQQRFVFLEGKHWK